jgi:hypothetical protein
MTLSEEPMRHLRLTLLPFAFLPGLACRSSTEPQDAARVVVDGGTFVRAPKDGATVPYTIANDGRSTLYVAACDFRPQAGIANPALSMDGTGAGICTANVSMAPVAVRAHGTLAGTVIALTAGTSRVVVLISASPSGAGMSAVRSNSFIVR